MNEYVTNYVRNYQNAPMMIFVMNVVLYISTMLERRMSHCGLCSE